MASKYLECESAQGIQVAIECCKPVQMTIDYEESAQEHYNSVVKTPMSGQYG